MLEFDSRSLGLQTCSLEGDILVRDLGGQSASTFRVFCRSPSPSAAARLLPVRLPGGNGAECSLSVGEEALLAPSGQK